MRCSSTRIWPRRVALAHDFGHTPFGHAGEDALDALMRPMAASTTMPSRCASSRRLERRYADFDGLNLTWETLEGLVKHNGPLIDTRRARARPLSGQRLAGRDPRLCRDSTISSSTAMPASRRRCAAIADDIAYNTHDIDDGLRAGCSTSSRCWTTCRSPASADAKYCAYIRSSNGRALDPRDRAPGDHPHGRGCDRRNRSARAAAGGSAQPTRCGLQASPVVGI